MTPRVESGAYVNKPPWWAGTGYDQGQVIMRDEWPKSWELARKGVLDWEPREAPVYTDTEEQIDGWKRVYRSDNNHTLTVQQESYAVITNTELGGIVEYLLEDSTIKYECVMSLKEGRQVLVVMYLDEPLTPHGDKMPSYPYLTVWTRHDGSGGLKGTPSILRVECANMAQAAELAGDAAGVSFTIRHTANWRAKLEDAKTFIQMSRAGMKSYVDMVETMSRITIHEEDVQRFLDRVYPFSTKMGLEAERNMKQRRRQWSRLWDSTTNDSFRNTQWGLVSTTIEQLDHHKGGSWDVRNAHYLLGSGTRRGENNPWPTKREAVRVAASI